MDIETFEKIDKSHGSAYDRGGADAYYRRTPDPHKYPNGTYNEPRIPKEQLTPEEIEAYWYAFNKQDSFKDYD